MTIQTTTSAAEIAPRWVVDLDGDTHSAHRSRREAREHASWLRRHPACCDRRRYGHGGLVTIIDSHRPQAATD